MTILMTSDSLKIDLGSKTNAQNWFIVNDGVMGGLSKGKISYQEESVRFSGKLSLENNGGFSWMKSSMSEIDLSTYTHVRLKVKGEGREYDFTIESSTGYSALYFKHTLQTQKGEWTTVDLPLKDFKQKYFGRMTGKSLEKNDVIRRIGFLMNDKNTGAFQVDIDYIEFY